MEMKNVYCLIKLAIICFSAIGVMLYFAWREKKEIEKRRGY